MKLRKSSYYVSRFYTVIIHQVVMHNKTHNLCKVNQLSLAENKINTAMLLTNSADKLSDIPPIPCEDEELKMLSLDQHVVAQNVFNMSETVFERKDQ